MRRVGLTLNISRAWPNAARLVTIFSLLSALRVMRRMRPPERVNSCILCEISTKVLEEGFREYVNENEIGGGVEHALVESLYVFLVLFIGVFSFNNGIRFSDCLNNLSSVID